MADTDEEQVEAIKKWLDENGTSLVVGIVVAVAGVFGFQSWQNSTREAGEAAASLFQSLTDAAVVAPTVTLDEETLQSSRFIADTLKTDHGDTTYAQFAALLMARLAVEENDLELAIKELQWVLDHGPQESVEVITRMRLARVLLASQKRDEALAQVESLDAGAHESSRQEALGDIYLTQERHEDARAAYQAALDAMTDGAVKPILEMKLRDVPAMASAGTQVVDSAADAGTDAPATDDGAEAGS